MTFDEKMKALRRRYEEEGEKMRSARARRKEIESEFESLRKEQPNYTIVSFKDVCRFGSWNPEEHVYGKGNSSLRS